MTHFIYEREDYVEQLKETVRKHEVCNFDDYITLNELLDHIEAQGKQLRELNKTIEKYEREKETLQKSNSEDLTWKQKYEALLHSSEQAIGALQKKCQEYKNAETDATVKTIETLVKENKELEEKVKRLDTRINELIVLCDEEYDNNKKLKEKNKKIDALEEENKELKEEINLYIGVCNTKHEEVKALAKAGRCPWGNNAEIISAKTARIKELKRQLEDEKQVSKDLNTIINSKNNLLDEYMTKCNKFESELMDYIKENSKLRAKIARIGGMCDGIKKIVKE